MLVFVQLMTVLLVVAGTFLVFKALGQRGANLLYTKQEREEWETQVGSRMLPWFTRTNIVGTLTSLATVWLFFIGSSKLFGGWIFMCSLCIFLGAFVTNYFTTRIVRSKHMRELLRSNDQRGGVIASVFWRSTAPGQQTAALVKWTSLFSITAIVWLEFALFADISGLLLGMDTLAFKIPVLAACCFAVVYFTFRYALRGFVFADLFHSPLRRSALWFFLLGARSCFSATRSPRTA